MDGSVQLARGETTQVGSRGVIPALRRLGPAFVAAVAYIDPGNYATNIEAGSRYGYQLLWVVLWASLMAVLIQLLSSKLGIATRSSLASLIRKRLPPWASTLYWFQAEALAIATDLAEFVGASLGFQLVFGISLIAGAACTAAMSCAILMLEKGGLKPLEAVIGTMLGVVALIYLGEVALSRPEPLAVLHGAIVPRLTDRGSLLAAAGILGATVMPHVIYLHSALSRSETDGQKRGSAPALFKASCWDVGIAMTLATFVNMAMLAMSAAVLHGQAIGQGSIEQAYRTLEPMLGNAAMKIFGGSLIIAGVSSTVVGTLAGQEVMKDFMSLRLSVWIRRGVTMVPSLVAIWWGADVTRLLVVSQVVLSFGIAFALVPLLLFTSDPRTMGEMVNRRATTIAGWSCVAVILVLNLVVLASNL